MAKKDPRVDAYIAKSADFAKPILKHLRELVHKACPEAEETIKWSMPSFTYKGLLCGMAAFKEHCSFGAWKHSLICKNVASGQRDGMGHFGKISRMADLPPDSVLLKYLAEAKRLNDEGIQRPRNPKTSAKKELAVPDYLIAALKKNQKAREVFAGFSYSHKKEYVEWLAEAKTEPTRQKRLATTIEWLSGGKSRNWKYVNC